MKLSYKDIIQDTNSLLRKKSVPVSLPLKKKDRQILMDMMQYVRDSQDEQLAKEEDLRPAVGLAAVQIGILKQMLAVVLPQEDGSDEEYALVNPKIISHSVQNAYLKAGEGCLSVETEHQGYVYRHARIQIKAYDALQNKEVIIKAKDYTAIVLQHEMDHHLGIMFYDHIFKDDPWKEDPNALVID